MLDWLSDITRSFMRFDETSAMLDNILYEARQVSAADAGTVYLLEGDRLVFAYTHNDTLFPVESAHKYAYANARLALDEQSLAGYCAVSRAPLNIADVRHLPPELPFSFNDSFDHATGYQTVSVLSFPLIGLRDTLLGVIQLINSTGPDGVQPFTPAIERQLTFLGVQAATALERSMLARTMIHRMQMMAALCDPKETGPHAERVGAIAAEVYQVWAERHGVPVDTLRDFRSQLRLAAMVHDLGKVSIPKKVLKKPGRLSPEERVIMQSHCLAGAELFFAPRLEIDIMSRDVALHHHQKWNGTGYTGDPSTPPLAGTAIPLAARVTAVADVFDALVSPRCYKKAWAWADAIALLQKSAGEHFDPEIVDAFLSVQDLIAHIFARYPDLDSRGYD